MISIKNLTLRENSKGNLNIKSGQLNGMKIISVFLKLINAYSSKNKLLLSIFIVYRHVL